MGRERNLERETQEREIWKRDTMEREKLERAKEEREILLPRTRWKQENQTSVKIEDGTMTKKQLMI